MKRKAITALGLLLLAAFLLSPVSAGIAEAQATPIPHAFYGNLQTTGGAPAPAGRVVTARVEGVAAGDPLTTVEAGRYGGPGPLELKLIVQGNIVNGTPIQFYVDGVLATPSDPEKAKFKSGEITELHLTYTPPVTPPSPGPPSPGPSPSTKYKLTVTSTTGGTVTRPGEGTFSYDEGAVVNLMARPEGAYRFVRWTGDVETIADVNAATTTITMNGDYEIVANFALPPIQYTLTISSTAGGSVTTPGEGTFSYDEGTVVNLVARADEGYRFVRWTGDVQTIANVNGATTTITMRGDYEITAVFALPPIQYTLTTSSTAGGSVTAPGEGTFDYEEGTVVQLVAEPEDGYRFVNWTGDVETIADVNVATTTITLDGDYVIVANFKSRVNRALIAGIAGGAVAIGLVTYFLIRRRRRLQG